MLAGAPGFEPGDGGIKIRCLTTWLRPNAQCRNTAGGPPSARRTITARSQGINPGINAHMAPSVYRHPATPYNNVWERRLAWAGGAYGEATVSDPVLVTNQDGVRVVR